MKLGFSEFSKETCLLSLDPQSWVIRTGHCSRGNSFRPFSIPETTCGAWTMLSARFVKTQFRMRMIIVDPAKYA